jgi:hypothetical protein
MLSGSSLGAHWELSGSLLQLRVYDIEQGEVPIKEWGQHLLRYYDGQFLGDSLFGLSLYNIIQQHTNNREGNFFFNSDQFIGKDPPTVEQLKRQLKNKNTKYISMLKHFARNIRGSDNFWRSKTEVLNTGSLTILHVVMAHPRSLSRCLAQKTGGQI